MSPWGEDSEVVQSFRVAAGAAKQPAQVLQPPVLPGWAGALCMHTSSGDGGGGVGSHPLEAWGSGRQKPGLQMGLSPHLCFSPRDGQVGGQEGQISAWLPVI